MQLEMKQQVNSENDDMDTQTSDNKHTWRRSGKHTRRKADECTHQLEMISARSTGRMLSVPTSAPTWRMISATAWAPKRWWHDQVRLIYAKRVQLCLLKWFRTGHRTTAFCLPKQLWTSPKMISKCTEWFTERHHERQSRQLSRGDDWAYRPRSWPSVSILGLNKWIIGSPLPKELTGMFTELDVERPYWGL